MDLLKMLGSKLEKFKKECNLQKNMFASISKSDPDVMKTTFGQTIETFLDKIDKTVQDFDQAMELVNDSFIETSDAFMIGKNDEMR